MAAVFSRDSHENSFEQSTQIKASLPTDEVTECKGPHCSLVCRTGGQTGLGKIAGGALLRFPMGSPYQCKDVFAHFCYMYQ